ncbi:uncharacterized protein L969DRAFT_89262 [Mixia osmundae IAM 14324]|uniref:START domain-containing protein n=1 Tax=Mixia osmundae (strain CBS 9802 / IAM 14324 / JCM 22182 / KY 12970) TaxID=764103 RepID=G7DSC9_MIXOS|nr:uncharacterized protein L969DRAFT_89262 [Mixia osmundae IAM 14324]KEI38015.1 hypothetical protein L969DRAFT_89262 [Mixia osmundae IAM 14324]GAA93489.1 hypothetical protein E5Q_00130 [Mixia osmundae IAM 14324]
MAAAEGPISKRHIVSDDASSRTAFALVSSVAPLYFLITLKQRLSLDNLHLGLVEVVLLLVLRFVINLNPVNAVRRAESVAGVVSQADQDEYDRSSVVPKARRLKRKPKSRKSAKSKGEHPVYTDAVIDKCLYSMLAIVDPKPLGELKEPKDDTPAPIPLDQWALVHDSERTKVMKHPSMPQLYAISSTFPELEVRKLWEVLIDAGNRVTWDGLCEKAETVEELGPRGVKADGKRQGSIAYLAMKGMFPVKAKDMCLLSIITRLPPTASTVPDSSDKPILRLMCATTSVEHKDRPEQSGYNRMKLAISGFVAEEDGHGGSRLIQITDLSGLGSWVPDKIIQLVTKNIIPKSLAKVGKLAETYEPKKERAALQGDDWLPPLLGSWDDPALAKEAQGADAGEIEADDSEGEEGEEEEEDDDDEELANMPASEARSLRELVVQLRTVTSRLSSLESGTKNEQSGWLQRIMPSNAAVHQSTGLAGVLSSSVFGGAVGAATVFALFMRMTRRRQ